MRDADNGTGILLQMLLQPVDRLGVQVVGRLIQQQYVRLLEQQSAKGHPATLASAFIEAMSEVAVVEKKPSMEGNTMSTVLAPKKK